MSQTSFDSVALYEFSKVQKRHSDDFSLQISDLKVQAGETLALIGPTGSGKSTLLRLAAGLESPDEGLVSFRKGNLHTLSSNRSLLRSITLVFQRPLLLKGTVRQNVEYPLRLRKQQQTVDRVKHVLEQLQLTSLAERSAATLSGGQVQLVALARALVFDPEVLLLDEPTANLDPAHVTLVEQIISEINQSQRTTVIWATHNLFQARRVSQRVALLLDGKMIEHAETEPFFQSPQDPRAAAFVRGEMIY